MMIARTHALPRLALGIAGLALGLALVMAGPTRAADRLPEQVAFEEARAAYGADDDRTLLKEFQLAAALASRDDYARAVVHMRHFRDARIARDGEDSPEGLIAAAGLGPAMAYSGDREGALKLVEDAYRRAQPRGTNDPVVIMVRTGLGSTLLISGRYEAALPHLQAGFEGMGRLFGPTSLQTRQIGALLVEANQGAGLTADALAVRRRIAVPAGPNAGPDEQLMAAGQQLALLTQEDHYEEARDLGETLVARLTAMRGPDHLTTLEAKAALSTAYVYLGQKERGIALRREVYDAFVRKRGPDDLQAFRHGEVLAQYGRMSADPAERTRAMVLMRDVMQRRARAQGPDAPGVLLDLLALGTMAIDDAYEGGAAPGSPGEAAYRQAIADLRAADQRIAKNPDQADSQVALAINMLLATQALNEGEGEAAYWRSKYSAQVVRRRSLDRRVAGDQTAALAEVAHYRNIFVNQVRAGWMWAHKP